MHRGGKRGGTFRLNGGDDEFCDIFAGKKSLMAFARVGEKGVFRRPLSRVHYRSVITSEEEEEKLSEN